MTRKTKTKISLFLTTIITLYSLFTPLMDVKADGSYTAKINGGSVSLRSKPTTDKNSDSSSNVIDYLNVSPDKIDVVTVLSSTKYTGTDCDEGWLNVTFEDKTGYVCSKYVTTNDPYGRPWNTPKKSIMGGAKLISNKYINAGQYTAYLEHFNVNPNSDSGLYLNIYQTDIEAPTTFAKLEQSALWKNDSTKNLPLIFTIPIFNNMKDRYTCSDCSKHPSVNPEDKLTASEYVAKTGDSEYEKYLDSQQFPESYKIYLRQLHIEHSNWVFKSLITNLDFDTAAANVAVFSAVNSSWATDQNSDKTKSFENGWGYQATPTTASYYLDPRNFLTETYTFQFMNLNYDDLYTETMINKVLASSFMSGMDFIDNQTYASIFLEAGKTYNVNPLYLSAHSLVEVGSSGTNAAATGAEIEYKNITYSGLFNFLSVGATSGSYSGIAYASGGFCTACANYNGSNQNSGTNPTNNNNPTNVVTHITSGSNLGISFSGNYVKGFGIGTLINDLRNKDGNVSYDTDDLIKTGTKLTFADGTNFTAIVYGDVTGDGKVNSADLLKMRQYLLGQTGLDGAFNEAANIAGNGTINSANLLKLRQYLLGNANISQG